VRIGEPARKHGVADEDILHGVRNAMRRIDMEENLAMLIRPASDGTLRSSPSSTLMDTTQ